ncbi:MAG: site-specific integrase [Thermodesulfobacteriota bacterium]|nr:site-specific integrase [Thermodesulfobacteriota bacterium]
MDQVKEVLRYHHYAYRTETTYCQWILRYIHYYGGKTHPREMGRQQVEAFLSNLVSQGNVASSTQRQALNALVFLYGLSHCYGYAIGSVTNRALTGFNSIYLTADGKYRSSITKEGNRPCHRYPLFPLKKINHPGISAMRFTEGFHAYPPLFV